MPSQTRLYGAPSRLLYDEIVEVAFVWAFFTAVAALTPPVYIEISAFKTSVRTST